MLMGHFEIKDVIAHQALPEGIWSTFDHRDRLHHSRGSFVRLGRQEDGVDEKGDNPKQAEDIDRQLEIAGKFDALARA